MPRAHQYPERDPRPWRDRRTRPLLTSYLLAELADGVVAVLVPLTVYALTGSVSLLALAFLSRLLLAAVAGWVGGWWADRISRRALLAWSLAARIAVLCLMLTPLPFWAFALAGVTLGAVGAFDNPAAEAGLRVLHRHDLTSLAVVRKAGQALSQLVGPALAGLLVGLGGSMIGLLGSLVLFACALLMLRRVGQLTANVKGATSIVTSSTALELPRLLRSWTLPIFMSALSSSLLVGVVVALGVPALEDNPSAPPGAYGYALSAYSGGALLGLWLAGRIRWPEVHLPRVLIISSALYGPVAVIGFMGPWWALPASWFIWGVVFGPESVMADTYVARTTPDRLLARTYALWSVISRSGAALAYLWVLIAGGIGPAALALTSAILLTLMMPPMLLLTLRRTQR